MRSRRGNGLPSTVMRSRAVTLSAGDAIVAPLTATRPAAIHSSASRREASPARAIDLGDALAGFVLVASLRFIVCAQSCG